MFRNLVLITVLGLFGLAVNAQTTEFTFQGSLQNSGAPATGNFDFEFLLYDSLTGGTQNGSTLTRGPVLVSAGAFSVKLDFGGQFPGANRFLEIRVRQTGGGALIPLAPRQQVNSSPYSVKSLNTDQLGGVAANQFVTTTGGGANFIQNTASPQAASNFNISGNGTAGGIMSGNIVNAATQYNIDGSRVLRVIGTDNIFAGKGAGQSYVQGASGNASNAFFGANSGFSNIFGVNNSYFGARSGQQGISGNNNSLFGTSSGQMNTGSENSFFGTGSGQLNTLGFQNSFFGAFSGDSNINGVDNSFFGQGTGTLNTSGSGNNFIGKSSGMNNSSGSGNTFVGANSGASITIENNNVFIGNNANGIAGTTNATAIGTYASVTQSNSLVLGSINGINGATADTNVGIGTSAPSFKLTIFDSSNTGLRVVTNLAGGTVASFAANGAFQVDAAGIPGGRFTVKEDGNVGIGNPNPADKLNVNGNVSFFLASGGTTSVCQNASLQISTCSSSLRYKQNVSPFANGLSLIKQLRPVSFNWRSDNQADLGLVAEEVAKIEPLLTTTSGKGQVEGVKYDRVGVVLINAVNEQQKQIEAQQKQIEQQRKQIENLTKIVCEINSKADVCQE